MTLAEKYKRLKVMVGGNREKTGYEETFGMPEEEFWKITMPNASIRRILAETEFSIRLSQELEGRYDKDVEAALDYLQARIDEDGVLTNSACMEGERLLLPLSEEAQKYSLILAAHAHIDMNWMWGWHETVAATIATFQTMLKLMEEYPGFCFSQSQASVYQIIERYAPELMEPMKRRIQEGRWEVTASAWVETDKNMPSTESLLNHIRYTKEYLQKSWGVDPDSLEIDFSPDTFGHSANLPELDSLGGVKYYYHCRGLDGDNALYRWRAPSGRELLVYREQHWYNSGITPEPAMSLIDKSRRSGGLKTGLMVYGVGDHGGGPTRRDLNRAVEMMGWPVFPRVRFGTFREFFREAEGVRENLPILQHELNSFATGCYTTQSRIKMGNRHCEAALHDAQLWNAFSKGIGVSEYDEKQYSSAWHSVLFTHFHDILTGSCVQESREHAMGELSHALAVANTRTSLAMQALVENMDTSRYAQEDDPDSQSYGAGAGYGVSQYTGPPSPERGSGKRRLFHLFNSSAIERREPVELTVWDWNGELGQLSFQNAAGEDLDFQLLDKQLQTYWDHKYFRVLVEVAVPALGTALVVMGERELEEYPFYLQPSRHTAHPVINPVLENEFLRAEFSSQNGALLSLMDKTVGEERLRSGATGGLQLIWTERKSSSAWDIGRYERIVDNFETSRITPIDGPLMQGFEMEQRFEGSSAVIQITLSKGIPALEINLKVDWNESSAQGGAVPVLAYHIPLKQGERCFCDIPGGTQEKEIQEIDFAGQQYAAFQFGDRTVSLVSDCKYGYRATCRGLSCTLINSTYSPDPYPERGVHHIKLHVLVGDKEPKALEDEAFCLNHPIVFQSGSAHSGKLSTDGRFMKLDSGSAVLSGVAWQNDGVTLRFYEVAGESTNVSLTPAFIITSASFCDVLGRARSGELLMDKNTVKFSMRPNSMEEIKLTV